MGEEGGGVADVRIEFVLPLGPVDEEGLLLVVDGLIVSSPGGGRDISQIERERG